MIQGETILSVAPTDGVSPVKVMHSDAGYYLGTTVLDHELGCEFPNTRESGYFPTEAMALEVLAQWESGDLSGARK